MNEDTNELLTWIESEPDYQLILKPWITNEIVFIDQLFGIILHINEQLTEEAQITLENVNGNEIYVEFSKLIGNEQEGWS